MSLKIIPFESGINTSYIIQDEGIVIVDGIPFKDESSFLKVLQDHEINPEEIQLIILTHGDFDHVGGAKVMKELTGARIAIHDKDRGNLETGSFHWPEGVTFWGKLSRMMFKPIMKKVMAFPAVMADIVLSDNGLSLKEFGIQGDVVYTPGHTYGSVSVLLHSGEAFVGCLAHNRPPFVFRPKLPIYAKDIDMLKKSWKKVIDGGATIIYPGHGKPFPVNRILKYVN